MSKFNYFSAKPGYSSLFVCSLVCSFLVMGPGINNASASSGPGCDGSPECVLLYDSWNRDGVGNNPPTYPVFTITQSWDIINIQDYHFNDGAGQDPITVNGNISLYDNTTGALIGSWAASSPDSSSPYGSYGYTLWEVFPKVILNPGSYKIVDSDPATWSYSTSDYFHLPGDGPNWQPGVGFSAVSAAVPAPAAIWLFGSALAGLIRFGRCKRFRY